MSYDPVTGWIRARLGDLPDLSESGTFRVAGKDIEIRTNSAAALCAVTEDLAAHEVIPGEDDPASKGRAIHLYDLTGEVAEGARMPEGEGVPHPSEVRETEELEHARWGDVRSFWSSKEFGVSYSVEEDRPFRVVLCIPATGEERPGGPGAAPGCTRVRSDERSNREILVDIVRVILARAAGGLCLHAALVAREGRGILICGESGSGKTTTALALGRGGHQVQSDEMVIADASGAGALELHPLRLRPRLFRAPGTTGSPDFSGLEAALSSETSGDKDRLDLPEAATGEATTLEALIFLEPEAVRGEHSARPVSPQEALMKLVDQVLDPTNVFDPGRQLEAMSRVVEECPAHAVSLGPRIRTIPAFVQGLLDADGA